MPEFRSAVRSIESQQVRRVILACTLGTACEWYDFYLYATLAPFFAGLFFPGGNLSAALLSAYATYSAGFLVRPLGGVFFGWIGDRIGRKYTVLITVMLMGATTLAMGCLPTYRAIGGGAAVILVLLRIVQGLALGGDYSGSAVMLAEFFPRHRRSFGTSWIQISATLGLLSSIAAVFVLRKFFSAADFADFGWRVPFGLAAPLFVVSFLLRLRLTESPVFEQMRTDGRISGTPLAESLLRWRNLARILFALFGACAGQGVVWYTSQYYTLVFMTTTLHVSERQADALVGGALVAVLPLFVVVGLLADRFGRLRFIVAGCALMVLLSFPLFNRLTEAVNPALAEWNAQHHVVVSAEDCHFHLFVGPWSEFTPCDRVKGMLASRGVALQMIPGESGNVATLQIDDEVLVGYAPDAIDLALQRHGFRLGPDPERLDVGAAFLVLFTLACLVAMVYGPMAAFLVGLFPDNVRFTSFSLPYHIGNGLFGGVVPLMATALTAETGNIYAGLYYPVAVAAVTTVIGGIFAWHRRGVAQVEETLI